MSVCVSLDDVRLLSTGVVRVYMFRGCLGVYLIGYVENCWCLPMQ